MHDTPNSGKLEGLRSHSRLTAAAVFWFLVQMLPVWREFLDRVFVAVTIFDTPAKTGNHVSLYIPHWI